MIWQIFSKDTLSILYVLLTSHEKATEVVAMLAHRTSLNAEVRAVANIKWPHCTVPSAAFAFQWYKFHCESSRNARCGAPTWQQPYAIIFDIQV